MTVFQGSSFSPDTIELMTRAFEDAVDTLPFPVGSARVQALAKNIVELASQGERDPERLRLLALLALKSAQI
ncbi:hypothetical protein [Afipia clevelandensis]|uniref:Uncharacterized protein n=1 Tax=Afipia clevelandensis ATCC 49720 TaxID=883079 RepID=K8P089_9BRAD|nr:hypothetical protein [Afipia clevelandensis]EKS36017.1 hypothetical protein HMPREF9696_02229 [Afipia clevelandensis ATCC 49720]